MSKDDFQLRDVALTFKRLEKLLQVSGTAKAHLLTTFADAFDTEVLADVITNKLHGESVVWRSGHLASSLKTKSWANAKTLIGQIQAGSAAAPYAAMQEEGGTQKPSKAQWLTIPLTDIPEANAILFTDAGVARYGSAEDIEDTFVAKSKSGKMYIFQEEDGDRVPLFQLRKSVKIPGTHYLQGAIDDKAEAVQNKVFRELDLLFDKAMGL